MYTLIVLFGMGAQIAGAASLSKTHQHDVPPVASTRGDQKIVPSVLTVNAAAPTYYTFETHAAGTYFLPEQGQDMFDKNVTYQPRSDRTFRNDITAFAVTVASPAPDVAPLAMTAFGLIGVMWRARLKPVGA
ncbi:MAG: hypothetical protein Q7U28_10105 [Aquabacterium sp.]|nr:hypothetical protein [Aquabacterium sp.]